MQTCSWIKTITPVLPENIESIEGLLARDSDREEIVDFRQDFRKDFMSLWPGL
jgi:hypothetical protein